MIISIGSWQQEGNTDFCRIKEEREIFSKRSDGLLELARGWRDSTGGLRSG